MDTISFELVWKDSVEDFFQISVLLSTTNFCGKAKYYTTKVQMTELQQRITEFALSPNSCVQGRLGGLADDESKMELAFKYHGRSGKIVIAVEMDIEYAFNIILTSSAAAETDIGMLERFASRFAFFGKRDVGSKIELVAEI